MSRVILILKQIEFIILCIPCCVAFKYTYLKRMDYEAAAVILKTDIQVFTHLCKQSLNTCIWREKSMINIDVVNSYGESLLWEATTNDEIEALISLGINLDIQDMCGDTWLHNRRYQLVEHFLDIAEAKKYPIKLNPNLKNKKGDTIENSWSVGYCMARFSKCTHIFTEPLKKYEDIMYIGRTYVSKKAFKEHPDVIARDETIARLSSVLLLHETELAVERERSKKLEAKLESLRALIC